MPKKSNKIETEGRVQVLPPTYLDLTLHGFIKAVEAGKIVRNPANRKINRQRMNRIVQTFDVNAIGVPTLMDDGEGRLVLLDFHHRTEAILKLLETDGLDREALEYPLVLKVLPKGAPPAVRLRINNQAAYKSREKIVDGDTDFGRVFNALLEYFRDDLEIDIPPKFWNQLAYNVYAAGAVPKKSWPSLTYASIYSFRKNVAGLVDQSGPEGFSLGRAGCERIIDAVTWATGVLEHLSEKTDQPGTGLMFGFLVYRNAFHTTVTKPATAANRLAKIDDLTDIVANLGRSTRSDERLSRAIHPR